MILSVLVARLRACIRFKEEGRVPSSFVLNKSFDKAK